MWFKCVSCLARNVDSCICRSLEKKEELKILLIKMREEDEE